MSEEFDNISEQEKIDFEADSDTAEEAEKDCGNKSNKPSADADTKLELYDWVQCIVSALVVGILIFIFVARVVSVEGSSMYPTLCDTDKLITSNLFYTPKQGDVIVFQTDSYGKEPLVKRVIAVGGQTVDIDFESGTVYVDGKALDEPYVNEPTYEREDFSGEITVPEGCIFVLGDNRNHSTDSRCKDVGFVDERCIIGKVLFIVFPARTEEGRTWNRIGSVYN